MANVNTKSKTSDFRWFIVFWPYAHIQTAKYKTKLCTQTNKIYKQPNTQTNKTNIDKQTNKKKEKRTKQSHRDNETWW